MTSPSLPRRIARPISGAVVVAALLAGLVVGVIAEAAAPDRASAACAATNKTVGGVFRGSDSRRISGLVGVVLMDAQGREIDRFGCLSGGGYAFTDAINADPTSCCALLPVNGTAPGNTSYEDRWQISNAPANAVTMWVEAYPKSSEDAAATPYTHYGGAMRRLVAANTSADVYLPRTCAQGGNTATITGSVTKNGSPAAVKEVTAFSRASEGSGTLGFVAQRQAGASNGSYTVTSLAPDQRYALKIDLVDGSGYWFEHDYGQGVLVAACATTQVTFNLANGYATITSITSPPPDGASGPGAPSPKLTRTHQVVGSFRPVVGDFRNAGRDDILWFSPAGGDLVWRSTGDGGFTTSGIAINGAFDPIVGDFDGDQHDDIYWFSATGGDALYRGTVSGFSATYPNSNGDYSAHVGDFNGDGRDDIYWFSKYGGDAIYYGTPTGFSAIYPNANGELTAHVGDFNGDGRDDIYWFSPTGGDAIYYGQSSGFRATYPNANGAFKVLVGDYDGDTIDDIYWFSTSGGDALYYGNVGGFTAIYPNANGNFRPVVTNLDTTPGDDIIWYAPGTEGDAYWRSTGNRSNPFTGGSVSINGVYQPVTGKFDTAAGNDVLWYEPSSNPDALWYG
ncbi:MAG: FG-GAP repeat domain-containing protein [Microthrixaceae bacterium]